MSYSVQIITPLDYLVGNKPSVEGIVKKNSASLNALFGTIELNWAGQQSLVPASKIDIDGSGKFAYLSAEFFDREQEGNVIVSVCANSGKTALINGAILSSALSLTFDTLSGEIPDKGFAYIESEVVQYERTSATTLSIKRAMFLTKAADHADDVQIKFGLEYEACTQVNRYRVRLTKNL